MARGSQSLQICKTIQITVPGQQIEHNEAEMRTVALREDQNNNVNPDLNDNQEDLDHSSKIKTRSKGGLLDEELQAKLPECKKSRFSKQEAKGLTADHQSRSNLTTFPSSKSKPEFNSFHYMPQIYIDITGIDLFDHNIDKPCD